jgi:hypothetical protein
VIRVGDQMFQFSKAAGIHFYEVSDVLIFEDFYTRPLYRVVPINFALGHPHNEFLRNGLTLGKGLRVFAVEKMLYREASQAWFQILGGGRCVIVQ